MYLNEEGKIQLNKAMSILDSIISLEEVGFFSWDISRNTFEILEKITGFKHDKVTSLPEFIDTLVHPNDKEIARQDLKEFLDETVDSYQSTFRILDINHQEKWLFCKGISLKDNTLGAIIYDVTSNKFVTAHDYRTNLINGPYFMRKLNNSVQNALKNSYSGAVLYFEMDNLSSIINRYGFRFATDVINAFGQKIREVANFEDDIARLPHDRFVILRKQYQNLSEIESLSQEIIHLAKTPIQIEEKQIILNVSIGITTFPDTSTNVDELIRFCNFAMNHSQTIGSNTATFFDAALFTSYHRDMQIEIELPNAILNNELQVVFQPQYQILSKKIVGFEALIRWHNKNLGAVSPAEFIPIAEKRGYIISIGHWVIEQALATAQDWLEKDFDFGTISINISPVEFKQNNFKEQLVALCEIYAVPTSMVELEITEQSLMDRGQESKDIMRALIAAGFKIAIDDFGTGYSNLSSLIDFDFQTLKLDKSLIDNMNDVKYRYLMRYIIKSQAHMPYKIIAEGVETEETVSILKANGCHIIQGYYFSRPLAKGDAEGLLEKFKR